jgi:predicted amidohydrolase YtcJ
MAPVRHADLLLVAAGVAGRADADAVAVADRRILAVGRAAELAPLRGPGTEVVDLGGRRLLPGVHDAHMHLLSLARRDRHADCSGARSLVELGLALSGHGASLPAGEWVVGVGYDERRLPGRRHPSRADLDRLVPGRPVRLQHRGMHLDILNSLALDELAPADRAHGDPESGRFFEAGRRLRRRRAPVSQIRTDLAALANLLLRRGVTAVQDASVGNDAESWELFRAAKEAGDFPLDLAMMSGGPLDLDPLASEGLTVGPVKALAVEGGDPAELDESVRRARAAGRAVAIHAVTEAELVLALAALGRASPRHGPRRGPDRIEHASLIPEAMLAELRAAGVMVVGNPALTYGRGDAYLEATPAGCRSWLHRVRSLSAAGVRYAVGSDAPVGEPGPEPALRTLTSRRTRAGRRLNRDEAIGPATALGALTLEPARAIGRQREVGRVAPGQLANLAVFDELPELGEARLTIVRGQVRWRAEGL